MTLNDCERIAEVFRKRIVDIRKMFEPRDAHVPDVEQFAKVQVVSLAHDLGVEFAKDDPSFDNILVEVVRAEINRGKA